MATSLAFGFVFAAIITLLLIPCLYVILEDLKGRKPVHATPHPENQPVSGNA